MGDRAEVDWWSRFRDECLGLFRGERAEFDTFLAEMNSVASDITFTADVDWEQYRIVFLDLIITINSDGFLVTDLHTKPNTKNCLLLPSSAHPPHVTRASVYSLAIRIVRICSQEADRDKRLEELADRLRQRQYREQVIIAGIARAKAVQRGDALKKVMKEQQEVTRQHRLIVEYDRRSSPPVRDILESNYMGMVARDKRMGKTFPSIPRPTFAKGKSIQNMLCRAKLPPAKQVSTRAAAGASRSGLTRPEQVAWPVHS